MNINNYEQDYFTNQNTRYPKYDIGKYITSNPMKNYQTTDNNFNAKITFSPQSPLNEMIPKPKTDLRSISQNKSLNEQQSITRDHNFQKANSLRQIKNSSYYLATFINKIGQHNSFMSVIIHFIYKMKIIRNYISQNEFVNEGKNPISSLKNIFVKYPENKKIDISKFRYAFALLFKSAMTNKFEYDKPNDPCEFYFAFVNMLHSIYNDKPLNDIFIGENDEKCNCIAHKTLYINIIKHDECECSSINRTKCSSHNCIIDIPIEKVIAISLNHSTNIFYSKEKLFSFFKSSIQHSNYLLCPLNGKNCNYNRVKSTLILTNQNFPTYLAFAYEKSSINFFTLYHILHSLILIPQFFDLENIFVLRDNINLNTQYEFIGCVFQKKIFTYTCAIKCEGGSDVSNNWTYYDDENVKIFTSWVDLISYCLKNALIPYMLYYQMKNEDDFSKGDGYSMNITKEEFKILENYAMRCTEGKNDEYSMMRKKEHIVADESDLKRVKIETKNILNTNSNTNPYKKKSNNNVNVNMELAKKLENMPLQMKYTTAPNKQKENFAKTQNAFKLNKNQNMNIITENDTNPIAKSSDIVEHREDRIRPYIEKKAEKKILPDMWICSNCNSVNKATEYKCRSCSLINNKQREILEQTNIKTTKSIDMIKQSTNMNAEYKKISCLCYSNCKDNIVQNGICTLCGREVERKPKRIIVEKEIVYKNIKGSRAKSKETSPAIKNIKKVNDNHSYHNNGKKLAINRYDDMEEYQVMNSMNKRKEATYKYKATNTNNSNASNNGYLKKKLQEYMSKRK